MFAMLILKSFSISAAEINDLPKRIFELDLTDEKVSTQGGGLELFRAKNYCILTLSLYGEMGQEKYAFKFNNKGLIRTRYVGYSYPTNVYDLKPSTEFILDFDKTYKANENKSLLKKFNVYRGRVPRNLIIKNCQ